MECIWKPNTDSFGYVEYYETSCGSAFTFNNDDGIEENGFEYCPFCGKKIVLDDGKKNVFIGKFPQHGDYAHCPTCGAPGQIDLDTRTKVPVFENSIWWNPHENMWECNECYDK